MVNDVLKRLFACLIELNGCYLQASSGKKDLARRHCLELIKLLNSVLRLDTLDKAQKHSLIALSSHVLQFYNTSAQQDILSYGEKILWLSSLVNDHFYPPIIKMEGTPTFSEQFVGEKSQVKLNQLVYPKEEGVFLKDVDITCWTHAAEDLLNLHQDLLNNCSFVSSFLSLVERGQSNILIGLILPHVSQDLFFVKLHFNGSPRIVCVDNILPFSENPSRSYITKSSSNKDLLWPALIEKAYLSVLGSGYEFKGSNMAIDTYMLSGWIPEIVRIESRTLDYLETLWGPFCKGEVLLGLGSGALSASLSNKLNITPEHDYLLLTDCENDNLMLKNPWNILSKPFESFLSIRKSNIHFLKYLYINWNPEKIFKFHRSLQFIYILNDKDFSQYLKPQFSIKNESSLENTVWLLLEKHLPEMGPSSVFSMDIYATHSGERVLVPNQYTIAYKSGFSNSRLTLAKFAMVPGQNYTVVVSSSLKGSFTIGLYNNVSEDTFLSKARYNFKTSMPIIHGAWSSGASGGNWSFLSYIENPQYDIQINKRTLLLICLTSELLGEGVNFHLFRSTPQAKELALKAFDPKDLLFNEKYVVSHQYRAVELDPGFYKLILSTYSPQRCGHFKLLILHNADHQDIRISKINPSLGLFTDSFIMNWNNSNSISLRLSTIDDESTFTLRVRNSSSEDRKALFPQRSYLRLSILNSSHSLQSQSKWCNSIYGVFINYTLHSKGLFALIIERDRPGDTECTVAVGCNKKFVNAST